DDGPGQLERLGQADRARELPRGGAEDRPGVRGLDAVEPVDEVRDARLGDEADPGAFARAQARIPVMPLLEASRRRRREVTALATDRATGGEGDEASTRHATSLCAIGTRSPVPGVSRCRTPWRRGRARRPRRRGWPWPGWRRSARPHRPPAGP